MVTCKTEYAVSTADGVGWILCARTARIHLLMRAPDNDEFAVPVCGPCAVRLLAGPDIRGHRAIGAHPLALPACPHPSSRWDGAHCTIPTTDVDLALIEDVAVHG